MYVAQTIDSKHSVIATHEGSDNTVMISVYEGILGHTKSPIAQYKFNHREAMDLFRGLGIAADELAEATKPYADK